MRVATSQALQLRSLRRHEDLSSARALAFLQRCRWTCSLLHPQQLDGFALLVPCGHEHVNCNSFVRLPLKGWADLVGARTSSLGLGTPEAALPPPACELALEIFNRPGIKNANVFPDPVVVIEVLHCEIIIITFCSVTQAAHQFARYR